MSAHVGGVGGMRVEDYSVRFLMLTARVSGENVVCLEYVVVYRTGDTGTRMTGIGI